MNIVDSSGWLEYFAGGPNADKFSPPLSDSSNLKPDGLDDHAKFTASDDTPHRRR